jgi:hypothetical protein
MSGEGHDTGERAVWTGGSRAAHYREHAKHFQRLASTELQPRARAQLLGLAAEYEQLADMNRNSRAPVRSIRECGTT